MAWKILKLAQIDNVNLRGNAIEQLVTDAGNLHAADDVQRRLTIAEVRVDIKTKILTLTSNPKGYNIDKVLRLLATGNVVFSFFIIGIHPADRTIATSLVSILDARILRHTRVQFHWAGRASRGVTQLSGDLGWLFDHGRWSNGICGAQPEVVEDFIRERLLVVEVGIAHGLQAGDGAMARHQRDTSGDGPLVDEGFHARRNLRQPIGIHACFARVAALPGGETNRSQYEYSKRSHS